MIKLFLLALILISRCGLIQFIDMRFDSILFLEHRYTQRGRAATKQTFNPQISQITQIIKIIN